MRLSFPHPLLVWSGHVESTGGIISWRNPPLCCTLTLIVRQGHQTKTKQKHCSTYLNRLIIIYSNDSAIDPYTISTYSLEHKKRYNIVIGEEKCVCVIIPFLLDVRFVDVPAVATREEGHTGFLHFPSAVLALIFLSKFVVGPLRYMFKIVVS